MVTLSSVAAASAKGDEPEKLANVAFGIFWAIAWHWLTGLRSSCATAASVATRRIRQAMARTRNRGFMPPLRHFQSLKGCGMALRRSRRNQGPLLTFASLADSAEFSARSR